MKSVNFEAAIIIVLDPLCISTRALKQHWHMLYLYTGIPYNQPHGFSDNSPSNIVTHPAKPTAVAAGHPLTAHAASVILEDGGNAYDAAVAAMMASFVAEPLLSSMGGGGFLLAVPDEGQPLVLDFFADAPQHKRDKRDLDFYPIDGNFGDRIQEFHIGHAAATVPGMPAGIFAMHERFCSRPLIELAAPAIELARSGLIINTQQALVARILKPIIQSNASTRHTYGDLAEGSKWHNPALADFLDTFCRQHKDWFYQDQPAHSICQVHEQQGGLLQAEDFNNYQVISRTPQHLSINQYEVYTNPPPSNGGYLILKQLEHACRHAKDSFDVAVLLDAMQLAEQAKQQQHWQSQRGTSHISVVDATGNLASITLSNGECNGHVVPDCGFMLNNFLGEEDINPQGFMQWDPGVRIASMMSPTAVIGDDRRIALGSGGSNRIKSTLFLSIFRLLQGESLHQAIQAPRFHFENNHCDVEPGLSEADQNYLKKHCQQLTAWQSRHLYFGGVNAVESGQTVTACGDMRRHGCGLINHSTN